jgi:hypothetical protein
LECSAATYNEKFCSRSCSAKFNNRKKAKKPLKGNCAFCKAPCPVESKYCSSGCKKTDKARKAIENKPKERAQGKERVKNHRQRLRSKALKYKGAKCALCGYDKCERALQFHHIDPEKKSFAIGSKLIAWEKLKKELDKCMLLCANCHLETHYALDKSSLARKA